MQNIHKYLTFCFLLFVGFSKLANAQEEVNTRIKDQYMTYNQLIIDKNYDKALDYTNEGIFKIIPRDQMSSVIRQIFETPGMIIKATLPVVSDIQQVKLIRGKNYVKFISNNTIQMKFVDDEKSTSATETDRKTTLSLMKAGLTKTFGEDNVSYNESTGFFTLKSKKIVIASSDSKLTNWQFAVVENEATKKILSDFIPTELLN